MFIGFAWLVYFFASFVFLRGESQLLKNVEKKITAEEEQPIVSNGTPRLETTSIIPEYVNEPFAVALITTFAAIVLQV